MIEEKYIVEVANRLQGNLERIKREGEHFGYWLENTTAFSLLENKKVFIHRMIMSIQPIEGVRVEKSNYANGYCMKTRLGEFFYLDIENRVYNVKEEFLDKEYWGGKCKEMEKEIKERTEFLTRIENFNELTFMEKWKTGLFFTKKRNEKKEELRKKIQSAQKRICLYQKKEELFAEVVQLVGKLELIMKQYGYQLKYC